jgi:hypothetical protein
MSNWFECISSQKIPIGRGDFRRRCGVKRFTLEIDGIHFRRFESNQKRAPAASRRDGVGETDTAIAVSFGLPHEQLV